MSVNSLFAPENLCQCTGGTYNEASTQTIIPNGVSPLKKQFYKASNDTKKKISIKKHIQSSLKKKTSEHTNEKKCSNKKSNWYQSNGKKHECNIPQFNNQNKLNLLNQVQTTYKSKPILVRQQPKQITRQIIQISHHYHITHEQKTQLQRNSSPSTIFSRISINTKQSDPIFENTKHQMGNQSKHSTTIPETSKVNFIPTQQYFETSIQFPNENLKDKNHNKITQFRNVQSQYASSLQNSIGSTISVVDKNFIYQIENYYAKPNIPSAMTTANKPSSSTSSYQNKQFY